MVDLSTDVNAKRGAIEQSLHLIHRVYLLRPPTKVVILNLTVLQQISSQFYVDFNSSIDNMLRTVDNLSTRIVPIPSNYLLKPNLLTWFHKRSIHL